MRWTSIRVSGARGSGREEIVAALVGAGAGGIQEDGEVLVTTLPENSDLAAVRRAVRLNSAATLTCDELGEVDWEGAWIAQVGIQRIGKLVVWPPWLVDESCDAACSIVIDPAMAFGTGEHPTTRGVLRLMHDTIRQGDDVADLGTGSAVLAIAAIKLGASRVFAIEMDPDAIGNAEDNVARNGVGDRIAVLEGDAAVLLPLVAPVRVILANIISSVLLPLLPIMRASLSGDGRAIMSGLLAEERPSLLDHLTAAGWALDAEDTEGDWWSAAIAPR